ncbi:MAG: cupredoxin domain-containing protein [Chloroflexia bacterium]|nr:cupredoxin domain-containing protein [Chloroflexia bacterium]
MNRNLKRHLGAGLLVVLILALVASCGDDDSATGDDSNLRPVTATPTAVVGLPEDIEQFQVVIENGEFDEDSFSAIAEQPVMLTFVNRDTETYTFEVADVITATEIPAAAETVVSFNIPTTGEYEAQLLGPGGEEIDTMFFEVTGPGGT